MESEGGPDTVARSGANFDRRNKSDGQKTKRPKISDHYATTLLMASPLGYRAAARMHYGTILLVYCQGVPVLGRDTGEGVAVAVAVCSFGVGRIRQFGRVVLRSPAYGMDFSSCKFSPSGFRDVGNRVTIHWVHCFHFTIPLPRMLALLIPPDRTSFPIWM